MRLAALGAIAALACHATTPSRAQPRPYGPLPAETPWASPPAAPRPAPVSAPVSAPPARVAAIDILRWTNVERLAAGLVPLAWSETLARAATAHSAEMARLGYFEHTSPVAEHRTPLRRAQNAGLRGPSLFVAENIAMGTFHFGHARQIVRLWMDSPGHRANILRPNLRYLGVGVVRSGRDLYATQLFSTTP